MNARVILFLMIIVAVLGGAGLLPASSSEQTGPAAFDRRLTAREEAWVRRTLRSLTLDEKIGQMVMADANVYFQNRESEEYKKLVRHLTENKVSGVILFRSDVWPSAILINRWQQMAKIPLLISADLEMGMGMRFDNTPWWAPNMAVAATGDARWARLQGEATALESRAIGINWIYAPTVDVNNNPDNPVINTRSYGEDPAMVAAFSRAFIEGAQSAGVMACAKHFPGHGDTATDSHIGLPVVDVSRERLDRLELVPFRAAIDARVGSIMSAHIALPQIESEPAAPLRKLDEKEAAAAEFISLTESQSARITLPGTLSPKIMTGILREDLKYTGIITTDAMSMAGIAARYSPAEAAVKAVKAGADMILKSPDIEAAIAGIKTAVSMGEIPETRINASVEKILRAKAALDLSRKRTVDLENVDRDVSHPRFQEIAQQIADRSITLVRDEKKILPFITEPARDPAVEDLDTILNITFTDEEDRLITRTFVEELRTRAGKVDSLVVDPRAGKSELDHIFTRLDNEKFAIVVFSLAVRARSGKGTVALPEKGRYLAAELFKRDLPLIVISFGNPYLLAAIPDSPSYLLAYSPFPVSQKAAAKAILGEIEINGKLPISLPGLYQRGFGMHLEKKKRE